MKQKINPTIQPMTQDLNSAQLEEMVAQQSSPIVIDFHASWCAPCKAMAPDYERLSEDFQSSAQFFKLDVGEYPEIAARFQVNGLPTLVMICNGMNPEKQIGKQSYDQMKSWMNENLMRFNLKK